MNQPETKPFKTIKDLLGRFQGRGLPLVGEEAKVEEVMDAMLRSRHSRLLYVVDDAGRLLGNISLGQLVRHVFPRPHEPQIHPRSLLRMITHETARDIMHKHPVYAFEDDDLEAVLERMIELNVKEIPVVDEEKRIIADLTMVDLLHLLLDADENE